MDPILLVKAAIMGIVEGLTEFLPVSSTGHLILAGSLLGFTDDKSKVFDIAIQTGAILAVVIVYWHRLSGAVAHLGDSAAARRFIGNVAIGFLPAGVIGFLAYKSIKAYLFNAPVVATAFIVGGLIILWVESTHRQEIHHEADELPLATAGLIGLAQAVAMIPGTSRSGATIVGGRLLGLGRRAATEFSFFLAIPTMLGAFAKEAFDFRHELNSGNLGLIGLGFLVAFVSAYLVIRPFLEYVSTRGFIPFAYYRIILGGIIVAFTVTVGL